MNKDKPLSTDFDLSNIKIEIIPSRGSPRKIYDYRGEQVLRDEAKKRAYFKRQKLNMKKGRELQKQNDSK